MMSFNQSIKTVFRYLTSSSTDSNLGIEVSSGSVFPLTRINIEFSNNHQTRDSSSDSSEISITTMESSDDETSNNNDTPSTHDSNSSIGSVDLFGDEEESLDYNVDAENSEPTAFVSQESLDISNGNQVIEINETQFNPPNAANEDVIEIIDLCATQIPNLNTSNQRNLFDNSVIEIFDSPSVLSTSRRNTPPVRRFRQRPRLSPYEVTPIASSSQNRRSQLENPITCPICLENVRNHSPVSTNCGHIFCKECLRQALVAVKKCPMCKKNITLKQFHDIYI